MRGPSNGKQGVAKRLTRQALRAANGAALGVVVGGLVGGILGACSAFVVDFVATSYSHSAPFSTTYARYWPFCAVAGLWPGVVGGVLIGPLIAVRDASKRRFTAGLFGLGCGIAYAALNRTYVQPPNVEGALVLTAMSLSGLLGGLLMSGFLNGVRRRWRWWTRWEADNLPTETLMARGVLDRS